MQGLQITWLSKHFEKIIGRYEHLEHIVQVHDFSNCALVGIGFVSNGVSGGAGGEEGLGYMRRGFPRAAG